MSVLSVTFPRTTMYGENVDWIGRQRSAIRVANPSAKGPSLFQAVDHRVMINGTYDLRMAVDPRPICAMYTLRQCLRKARARRSRARARVHVLQGTRAGIRYTSRHSCIFVTPSVCTRWTCTLGTYAPYTGCFAGFTFPRRGRAFGHN